MDDNLRITSWLNPNQRDWLLKEHKRIKYPTEIIENEGNGKVALFYVSLDKSPMAKWHNDCFNLKQKPLDTMDRIL